MKERLWRDGGGRLFQTSGSNEERMIDVVDVTRSRNVQRRRRHRSWPTTRANVSDRLQFTGKASRRGSRQAAADENGETKLEELPANVDCETAETRTWSIIDININSFTIIITRYLAF